VRHACLTVFLKELLDFTVSLSCLSNQDRNQLVLIIAFFRHVVSQNLLSEGFERLFVLRCERIGPKLVRKLFVPK
jgi:hypothetical protein